LSKDLVFAELYMCGSAALLPEEPLRRLSITKYVCAYKRKERKNYRLFATSSNKDKKASVQSLVIQDKFEFGSSSFKE